MADFWNLSITRNGTFNPGAIPQWTVQAVIQNRSDGGPEPLNINTSFPQVLNQLSAAQQDEFVQMVVEWLLQRRFGAV